MIGLLGDIIARCDKCGISEKLPQRKYLSNSLNADIAHFPELQLWREVSPTYTIIHYRLLCPRCLNGVTKCPTKL